VKIFPDKNQDILVKIKAKTSYLKTDLHAVSDHLVEYKHNKCWNELKTLHASISFRMIH